MQISIVTINYNGLKETLKLLESLQNQSDKNFEIIIVDNASEEADSLNLQKIIHSFSLPARKACPAPIPPPPPIGGWRPSGSDWCGVGYPQVKFVKNSENLGFSGGNNVGIRVSLGLNKEADPVKSLQKGDNGASWVVLLNNDTWVEKDFIERLRAILGARTGVVGIPLVEGDPAPNLSADRHSLSGEKGRIWCGTSRVAYCGKIQWLKPTLKHVYSIKNLVLKNKENGFQNTKYLILDTRYYAVGGGMAIYKNVFEKIGLLDEKYFLYFEDADFSVQARKAGFNISIATDLNIHHQVSVSTKKLGSPLLLRYHYRNALYFNLKNGPWYIKLLIWPWSWVIIVKQLVKIAIKQNIEESKAILNGVMDFYKNKMGKIKAGTNTSKSS